MVFIKNFGVYYYFFSEEILSNCISTQFSNNSINFLPFIVQEVKPYENLKKK